MIFNYLVLGGLPNISPTFRPNEFPYYGFTISSFYGTESLYFCYWSCRDGSDAESYWESCVRYYVF